MTKESLDDIFDSFTTSYSLTPIRDGFLISFSVKGYGFGEWAFRINDQGCFEIDDEFSGPEMLKEALSVLIDNAKFKGR